MKITIARHRIQNVPVIEFYRPDAAEKLPLILIMPGFTGRKEDNELSAYQFAEQGYCAVSIDLHLHGELGVQPFIPADVSPRLIEVIEQSVHNLALLVGAYQDSPVADGKRIGLLGISLGGVIIYYYLPQRSSGVKTAVTMVAGLSPLMETTFRRIQEIYPQFGVTGALIDSLGQHGHSMPFLQNLNEFPLLMLHGKNDPLIPIERVREVFLTVQHGYKQPERLRLEEFDQTGHETPAEMYARAAEWFGKYL